MDFCWFLVACCKSRTSNFMRPRNVLLAFHNNRVFAFGLRFWSKKPTKNLPKTRPEPFKNRCRKRVVFQHRFFQVSASILEPLGPPTWNQVGSKTYFSQGGTLFFSPLKLNVFKNGVSDGSDIDFGGSWPRFWKLQVSILDGSGIDFSKFSSVFGFMSSKCLLHRHNAKKAKVWANCSQNVGFHFPMCLQHCSPAHASLKGMAVPQDSCTQMGRRRWPPWGEFNPPATEGAPTAC